MPFPRPAYSDLINSALADLSRVPNADITLRRSLLQVLAMMSAALASGEYDYIDWAVVNVLLPDTATEGYLDRWANIVGLQRQGATQAAGSVSFNVTGSNIFIPNGAQLQTSNGGVTVTLTSAGGTAVPNANYVLPAVASAGSVGNIAAGAPLTLLVNIAGVAGTAAVSTAFTGGTDVETDAALRVRVLNRLRNPPQGGAACDYVSWAQLVAGVTRVWVYPLYLGPGTVLLTFVMDGRANIIPLSADVTNVQAVIGTPSAPGAAPVTATTTVEAPTASSININIHNLQVQAGYTVATVQANIQATLAALFSTTTPGGLGWDSTANAFVTGGVLSLSQIYGAIAGAVGVSSFDLTSPTADSAAGFLVLFTLGSVTWV